MHGCCRQSYRRSLRADSTASYPSGSGGRHRPGHRVRAGHRRRRYPGRRHARRRQEPAARHRGSRVDPRRRHRPRLLGGAARQPAPAGRGGLRRPDLARRPGSRPVRASRRQRPRPVPRPRWICHHLPGRRRRSGPASGRVPPAPLFADRRRGASPAGAVRHDAGAARWRRSGRGVRLEPRPASHAGDIAAAVAVVRHVGTRGWARHLVAALPRRAAGGDTGGGHAGVRLGRRRLQPRPGAGRARRAAGGVRRHGRRGALARP